MGSNIWWLFFSMSAGIGFFWSILLLFGQSRHRPGTKALGLVLMIFSLTLVHYVMVWSGNIPQFPHLAGLWQASSYFYGPLLLLFFLGKEKISWKVFSLHLIPGLLLLLAWIPFGILPTSEKVAWIPEFSPFRTNLLIHRNLLYLLQPIFMVGVQLIYGLYFLWKSRMQENGDRKLKQLIAILFLTFIAAQISYFVLVEWPAFKPEWDYMISLAMVFCIFRIAFLTFQKPEYFFFLSKRSPLEGKYNTSPLSNGQSSLVANRVKDYVESQQAFLESDLRLPKLAKELDFSAHQVSQAINENFNCSFSEWINRYRITHACQLLTKEGCNAKEAGYQSGFNSLSAFYQVFKKEKGMSPARYSKLQSVD